MGQFQYTAQAVDERHAFTSSCYADDEDQVRSGLKRMGYKVDSIKAQKSDEIFGQRKRIKLADIVNMCRRFSVMYSAGLPLLECLSALAQGNESNNLSDALQDIHCQIEQGSNIGDAFSKHPKIFSSFFVNMLRAGEAAGEFDYVLGQLSIYIEKQYELKRKIRQAFAYPLIVAVMIFLVVTAIMIVVVPAFSEVYAKLGVPLPGPTITLIFISNNAVYIFPSIIAVAIGLWILYKKLRVEPAVKGWLDRKKLSVAMIGPVYHKIVLLKFIHTLSIVLAAGIELPKAISIAEDIADNTVTSEAVGMVNRNIKLGGTITEAIKLHGFFPKTIIHAFSTGEESGKLSEMLNKFASGLEQDVDDGIRRLVIKIEPMLMVVMSLVIGFILLAIYLPIFDVVKIMNK
ncbi:MAG: type II secretion system F family protein [Planctomycetota bacterium]|jgi:type IV pilus assembly protein PilC